jgi:hypothetical protein
MPDPDSDKSGQMDEIGKRPNAARPNKFLSEATKTSKGGAA